MLISFGYTSDELLAGKKTVTRRDWPDSHAKKFRPGAIANAWSKQPHFGGVLIARIRLIDVRREPLARLLEDPAYARRELELEGGRWKSVEEFLALFKELRHGHPYRVEFKLIERIARR